MKDILERISEHLYYVTPGSSIERMLLDAQKWIESLTEQLTAITAERDALKAALVDDQIAGTPEDYDDALNHKLNRTVAQFDTDHAALAMDYAKGDVQDGQYILAIPHLIDAIGHIIDVLRNMQRDEETTK